MKFTWFHRMPYRWLPEDFRERDHRGAKVVQVPDAGHLLGIERPQAYANALLAGSTTRPAPECGSHGVDPWSGALSSRGGLWYGPRRE